MPSHWWPEELDLEPLEQPCKILQGSNWHQMALNCCLFRTWHGHWLFEDEVWAWDEVGVQVTFNPNPNAIFFWNLMDFMLKLWPIVSHCLLSLWNSLKLKRLQDCTCYLNWKISLPLFHKSLTEFKSEWRKGNLGDREQPGRTWQVEMILFWQLVV